jgi:phosphoenolpyruvate carboxykinase (ATP)
MSSAHDMWKDKINSNQIRSDFNQQLLLDEISRKKTGTFTKYGAVVVKTGTHTGRAAKDKYVVESSGSKDKINWGADVKKMDQEVFLSILSDTLDYLGKQEDIYINHNIAGAHKIHNVDIRLVTPSPHHALFATHMFRTIPHDYREDAGYTIIHAPNFQVDSAKHKTRSSTVIVTNIEERVILIAGTSYAGEIKKSIFSILNYLLPEKKVMPMHAGSSIDQNDSVSLFFGLSGTGKTTLSTDEGTKLIGDDEHGLCDEGVFNFEGGCYAKTINLSQESEPEIYKACHTSGTILENVVMDPDTLEIDFKDNSLAENSRASYPLDAIEDRVESSTGPIPNNIFFLCADAFGVLPPVAKLSNKQALYYFLSGYTAKVAGTEMGVTEPSATFSTCFGAPFMIRHAVDYADLLEHYLNKYPIKVWLINTGWTGGPYGVGNRFPIKTTRSIIRAIQRDQLKDCSFETEEFFGLDIPKSIQNVDDSVLNPKSTWDNSEEYEKTAHKLSSMFKENFSQYKNCERLL